MRFTATVCLVFLAALLTACDRKAPAIQAKAEQLGIDAGVIAAGKLADLAIVDGNPLDDITATTRVRYTIANGRVFDVRALLPPRAPHTDR